MKILVVDDELALLKSLKSGLRTQHHTVVTTDSAEAALELIDRDRDPFDLIISDYLMAGMTGFDFWQELKRKNIVTPVIIMTAYGNKDVIFEAIQKQPIGFIEKPFNLNGLLLEIKRVMASTGS